MAQFRKSKKVGPFRFTLSQRGLSASAGAGPLRLSRGSDGKLRRTVRIPGAGLYDTRIVGGSTGRDPSKQPAYPDPESPRLRLNRGVIAPLGILAGIALLLIIGNSCESNRQRPSAPSTVTSTVTSSAPAITATITETASAEPPPPPMTVPESVGPTPSEAAPPPDCGRPARTAVAVKRLLRQLRGSPGGWCGTPICR